MIRTHPALCSPRRPAIRGGLPRFRCAPLSHSRILGLDGLRGLAAFMVIVHHTAIKGTDIGGLSVFMFFILSGFLITGILIGQRKAIEAGGETIGTALKAFWLQRALRIFPAYYFWFVVFLVVDELAFGEKTLPYWPWYVLYLQNFLIGYVTFAWAEFTHTWSLAVEQQYYVFFAPLVLIVPSRLQLAFFAGAIGLCLVAMSRGFEMVTLYTSPSTGFVFMACGAIMAATRGRVPAWVSSRPVFLLAVVLVVALALYPVAERNHIVKLPYVVLIVASALALSTVMLGILGRPLSWTVAILETRSLRFLGLISYALYIVHLPVGEWLEKNVDLERLGAVVGLSADMADFVIVSAVSILLATLSYHLVEKRFLALKQRLKRAPAPPDEAAPAL